ncbi:hypothetical protein Tco_0019325 [Tanacetum coccineum]
MADENVPAPAPTRSDDQILPFAAWVPIGKSNHVLDLQKRQKNPIFQIAVDILQNTNFFRAFTASASVPAIYIQQFWNTLTYVEKAGTYRFQLDEDWFTLDANLLREALEITPIDQAHPFVSPPSGDAIMDFMNQLRYTEVIHFVSRMAVDNLYQPWRAIMSMINPCLTRKTSGHDRPRYPVLQMLWGIITCTNVDFAELMWEEFVQAIQTFLTDKANLGSPTKKGRKDKPHVIPYCRFTKLIICHLGRIHNLYQRSASLFHLAEQDLRLGNLKFVPKREDDEVFGMLIPNELISNNIRNAPYYSAYLEMVAKHDQKVAAEKEGKKKTTSTKQPKPKPVIEKSSKPIYAPKPKVTKEKPSKDTTAKLPKPKPAKEKSTKLVDEPDEEPAHSEPEPEPEHEGAGEEYDIERAIQMSLESFQAHGHAHVGGVAIREPIAEATRPLPVVEGKGKAIVTEEQAAQSLLAMHTPKRRSTTDQFILQRRTPTTEEASTGPSAQPLDETSANIVRKSPSPTDAETGARSDKTSSGGDMEAYMDEDQVGPNPGIIHVALARPDPKPTHDEFMADLYPKVLESLKFPADEHQQSTTESELVEHVAALEKKLSDLEQTNKNLDNTTQNLGSRRDGFLAKKDKSRKRRRDDQDPPPPPPDSDLSKRRRHDTGASGPHDEQPVEDIPILDSPNISDSEDTSSVHLPHFKPRPAWLKPILEDDRPATLEPAWVIPTSHIPDAKKNWANVLATTYQAPVENSLLKKTRDMRTFMNWYCQKIGKTELTQADLEGQSYEVNNPEGDQVRIVIRKPLPLSCPPGHVTIQTQFFFNKDLDYLRYGSKGSEHALSISKMKVARYLDFGLELLILEDMWINETRSLVIRQRVEDFQLNIESYQKQLNLTKPGWDAKGFEYKHDYIIIDSPHTAVFPVGNNEWKIMRFNEIYKFSDGTLTNIMKALDYRVKEYKVNRLNPGMNTRFWTDKDVERSKEFIHAIEWRLKTRRIFQNLECFVGGRVHDIDYKLI